MYISNVTEGELYKALGKTNEKFHNIYFWELYNIKGSQWKVRLSVNSIDGHGVKRLHPHCIKQNNFKQGRISWACFHAHGEFFDNLFRLNPKTRIRTGYYSGPKSITKGIWKWEPMNLEKKTGGRYNPLTYGVWTGICTQNRGHLYIPLDMNRDFCDCLGEPEFMKKVRGKLYTYEELKESYESKQKA